MLQTHTGPIFMQRCLPSSGGSELVEYTQSLHLKARQSIHLLQFPAEILYEKMPQDSSFK